MNHPDAYGADDDELPELPELPIPRPGEWSPLGAASPEEAPRIQPPRLGNGLGGGASFTAASDDPSATYDVPHAPEAHLAPGPASPVDEHARAASEQFVWNLAAQLTSGMLANPARSNSSVKDAMGLFDQFLHEVHSYTRIASEFDLLGMEADRRRAHEEYFRRDLAREPQDPGGSAPTMPQGLPQTPPKIEPAQPRPGGDYRPIPPGVRGPYAPGTMGGAAPPPTHSPGEDEHAA